MAGGITGYKRLLGLHASLRPWAYWLVDLAVAQGWSVHITSVYRSAKEQAVLHDEFLFGGRRFPAAAPWCSQHQYGLAWDMVIGGDFNGPLQRALGGAWNEVGGSWGGLTDQVHFGVHWTRPQGC